MYNIAMIQTVYHIIVQTLRKEYGQFVLSDKTLDINNIGYAHRELIDFMLNENNVERIIDIIEISFRFIDSITRNYDYMRRDDFNDIADDAISELNARFNEHGVGYTYVHKQIIRIDSQYIHSEAVVPVLRVLHQNGFDSALKEFLAAQEHYRHGRKAEALLNCCKSFESTMKIICTKRKWAFEQADTAKRLVQICLDKGLVPAYWQSHYNGLRSVLESGISTPRNREASHGAGAQPITELPDELVAYVLHMTAATILFMSEAEAKL